MRRRGAVYAEQAYAQGKMLDHSAWQLPRKITPSDFDCVFDNAGRIVFAEFSSSKEDWRQIDFGQRKAYISAIQRAPHVAALCKHSVPGNMLINSRDDVERFQIMFGKGEGVFTTEVCSGDRWPRLIEAWFASPDSVTRSLCKLNPKHIDVKLEPEKEQPQPIQPRVNVCDIPVEDWPF